MKTKNLIQQSKRAMKGFSLFTLLFSLALASCSKSEEAPKKANIGDFYYSDNTFSSTINATKTCIGIVYEVNTNGTTGKIMSLDEETSTLWSTKITDTGTADDNDGAANTANVFALGSYSASAYPAFAWCATKNTTAPAGISWYIPAILELKNGLSANRAILNTSLGRVSGATQLSTSWYWSSTQYDNYSAWSVNFSEGNTSLDNKDCISSVRVVSAF